MRFFKPLAVLALLCVLMIFACTSKNSKDETDQLAISSELNKTVYADFKSYAADTTFEQPANGNNNRQKFQQLPKTDWDKKDY